VFVFKLVLVVSTFAERVCIARKLSEILIAECPERTVNCVSGSMAGLLLKPSWS
jgi:hypothetical protein